GSQLTQGERMLDATEGRFLQRDPIGFAAGDVNLYEYVGGSPSNAADPLGREATPPTPKVIAQLIEQLDSASFEEREKAKERLRELLFHPKTMDEVRKQLNAVIASKPTLERRQRIENLLQEPEALRQRIRRLIHTMSYYPAICYPGADPVYVSRVLREAYKA